MAPSSTIVLTDESNRRKSFSGASALLLNRRFTRSNNSNTPIISSTDKSETTNETKRRATIDATTLLNEKIHVRIVPNIENPSRTLIFDIVDRELEIGSIIKVGRYSERHTSINCMSFKSKVVSRCHCEIWAEADGKLYIRDTKSSSGTFLNHVRLSPAGSESRAVQLNDGDIVQLGIDFQGGREEMYRSVKMKFEINRSRRARPLSFNLIAFQNLRNLTQQNQHTLPTTERHDSICTQSHNNFNSDISSNIAENEISMNQASSSNITSQNTSTMLDCNNSNGLEECCICLYAMAPFQALFVSPCSHTYHYKCIRPLLMSYPGFQCPICRTYSDLEASVETDEIVNTYDQELEYSESNLQSTSRQEQYITDELDQNQITQQMILSNVASSSSSPIIFHSPECLSHTPSFRQNNSIDPLNQVIEEASNGIQRHTDDERCVNIENIIHSVNQEHTTTPTRKIRDRRSSLFMEKLKMVFFEKRKSSTQPQLQNKQRKHNIDTRVRSLSYSNALSFDNNQVPINESGNNTNRINDIPSTSSNIPLLTSQSTTTSTFLNDISAATNNLTTIDSVMIDL